MSSSSMWQGAAPASAARPRNRLLKTCRAVVGAAAAVTGVFLAAAGWSVLSLRRRNPTTTAMMRLREREAETAGRALVMRHHWVSICEISPTLREAVILATDRRYYSHPGVDWLAIWKAWESNRQSGQRSRGGSTITVQVAKNLYFHPRKSYVRKAAEVPIAYLMEALLGKERILEIYLNIAEWGDGIFGAEAAAEFYFGKPAANLSVREASLLGAVLPNPRRWSPLKPTLYIAARAADIRRQMAR